MTTTEEGWVKSLLSAIRQFEQGSIDVEEVQSRVRSAFDLVESTHRHLRRPLDVAEADLEVIRFARPESQQVPEALVVLERLRLTLVEAPPDL